MSKSRSPQIPPLPGIKLRSTRPLLRVSDALYIPDLHARMPVESKKWERDMFLWPEIASGSLRLGYAQAGPVRTRYVEAGDAAANEAVVFIPGTGGHLEAFMRNLLPHAAHFRTIALDMVEIGRAHV